jgi:hypothetical protein
MRVLMPAQRVHAANRLHQPVVGVSQRRLGDRPRDVHAERQQRYVHVLRRVAVQRGLKGLGELGVMATRGRCICPSGAVVFEHLVRITSNRS